MANNTVNDVMNVIASPDYGIKNIAGTNQEILAILEGNHNSPNNIHSIVNDIKNLLQTLVVVASEPKPVDIDEKTVKIKHAINIQNIVDETKTISKSIDLLVKEIKKQGGDKQPTASIAKLSDKASDKVADAMIKNINKQNKGGGISGLVDAFNKLKNISLKDIIFGNQKVKLIGKIFKNAQKDLKIDEKDLNAIIKLINSAPEMMKVLKKVDRRIDKIIKNNVIGKLSDLLVGKTNSLLSLSLSLKKNEKNFNSANKSAKDIKELAESLNTAMKELIFTALWSKFASVGITSIEKVVDNLTPLTKKLVKNKKETKDSAKAAKNITVLVGNLLITSIFLTIAAVTGIPALLGALVLKVMVNMVIPIAKKLSKNNKHMLKAVGSAIIFTAFTGLMVISTLFLAKIADNGLSALLGSIFILGIIAINVLSFKLLGSQLGSMIKGSISLIIMSVSLLLFGIALGKIHEATKDMTWGQFGMIAAITVMFGLVMAIIGIPVVAGLIIAGGIAMAAMSVGLLIFGIALGKINKATKDLDFMQLLVVAGSIVVLGAATALVGLLSILVIPGSIALVALTVGVIAFSFALAIMTNATKDLTFEQVLIVAGAILVLGVVTALMGLGIIFIVLGTISMVAMSIGLFAFGLALSLISESVKNINENDIEFVCNSIKSFGEAFKEIGGPIDTTEIGLGAVSLNLISKSLSRFVKILKDIKDMGSVEKEVETTLKLIKKVGDFFKDNEFGGDAEDNAEDCVDLMKIFGITTLYLKMLKKIKKESLELVPQILSTILDITNHYKTHPIDDDIIDQAELYEEMMEPFGKTLKYLTKLKKMGDIPLGLVIQTLLSMSFIANHYVTNPIDDDIIDQAELYEDMLKPFGKTVGYFSKLGKIGDIPDSLVKQTLTSMTDIGNHYKTNKIDKETIKQAEKYEDMLKPFGKTVEYFSKLGKIGDIPDSLVKQTLTSMTDIGNHYKTNKIDKETIKQAEKYEDMMEPFGKTIEYMSKLQSMGTLPTDSVQSVLSAMTDITNFYNTIIIGEDAEDNSEKTQVLITNFSETTSIILNKLSNLSIIDNIALSSIISACRSIIWYYSFTPFFAKPMKVINMDFAVRMFVKTAEKLKADITGFGIAEIDSVNSAITSMRNILNFLRFDTLNFFERRIASKNIILLRDMSEVMSSVSKINSENIFSVGNAISASLAKVHSIDISQVKAVTNMFNAFNGINKSESILNKFTETINKFTEACENLMDAMGMNTDAINNIDNEGGMGNPFAGNVGGGGMNSVIETTTGEDGSETKGIRIANVDEIARNIAEQINGALSIDIPDTQIQLLINGSGGNEWTITRY